MMIIYCDGASNNHSGRSGIGAVWFRDDQLSDPMDGRSLIPGSEPEMVLSREIFGSKTSSICPTNNEAEYISLISALEMSIEHNIPRVTIFMDSKLVVSQVNGLWKINFDHLRNLKDKVDLLRDKIDFMVIHVRREFNTHADKQSKLCIQGKKPSPFDSWKET